MRLIRKWLAPGLISVVLGLILAACGESEKIDTLQLKPTAITTVTAVPIAHTPTIAIPMPTSTEVPATFTPALTSVPPQTVSKAELFAPVTPSSKITLIDTSSSIQVLNLKVVDQLKYNLTVLLNGLSKDNCWDFPPIRVEYKSEDLSTLNFVWNGTSTNLTISVEVHNAMPERGILRLKYDGTQVSKSVWECFGLGISELVSLLVYGITREQFNELIKEMDDSLNFQVIFSKEVNSILGKRRVIYTPALDLNAITFEIKPA